MISRSRSVMPYLEQEGFREGVHRQRGRDRVTQEIDDQKDPIQRVGDGAEQKPAFHARAWPLVWRRASGG